MKRITTLSILLVFFTAFIIVGCGDQPASIYTMCDEQSQICTDIESEGWCKYQRAELITRRYNAIQSPNDQDNQYRTLVAWRNFNQCIKTASEITRKTAEDRTSKKAMSYLASIKEIELLEQQTSDSSLPQLVYYHWVQDNKPQRINQLIKLDKGNKLATTELQLMMASYYAKVDKQKELQAQYNALKYLGTDHIETIDNQLFASLATTFLRQQDYRLAYVWTKVAELSGLKVNSSTSLQRQLKARSIDLAPLKIIANSTYESIKSHQFITPESQL